METEPEFKTLQITRLHPTFGAEVSGVDFSRPIPDDVLQEIISAMAKVICPSKISKSCNR
jgi:alpha-ketoglutarate-dependent 2,4-dichlorophenoxyacetate dioxygenase